MNNLQLKFQDFQFSEAEEHINKMQFSGVCLLAEQPSDGTPCGSDKPVKFSLTSCNNAINTFVGMGVDVVYDDWGYPETALTGHDSRFKIGVVESAEVQPDGKVFIKGSLWKHDFYDICFMIKNAKDSLGFSVEVMVSDMSEDNDFYTVNDFTFTGVAILYKNLAAFKNTQLAAQRKKESDSVMSEEQFKQFMESVNNISSAIKSVEEKLAGMEKQTIDFSAVTTAIDALGAKMDAQATPAPATPEPKVTDTPEPKAVNFAGKTEPKKIDFESIRNEVMNDVSIPAERKHRVMLQKWMDAQKD